MDSKKSPSASTPSTFQALNEEDPRAQVQVPSPIMDSELKDSNESTIVKSSSTENLSTTAQWDSGMEMTTVINSSVGKTPGVFTRTRSHDGEKMPPSLANFMMEELLSGLQAELQDANEHNEVDIYKV